MPNADPRIRKLLPLTPTVFHILLALADGPRHGYWIMQEVASRSDGQVGLGPGTLYGAIERMVDNGLIENARAPHDAKPEKRRRYYKMTELGTAALLAESDRMAALVGFVRDKPLASDAGPA